jgi:hypothetical protein
VDVEAGATTNECFHTAPHTQKSPRGAS